MWESSMLWMGGLYGQEGDFTPPLAIPLVPSSPLARLASLPLFPAIFSSKDLPDGAGADAMGSQHLAHL